MKIKAKHFIPGYGSYTYFKEYFDADKRDAKEATQASWMFGYHVWTPAVLILLLVKLVMVMAP